MRAFRRSFRPLQPTDLDTLHPINPPEWFSGWWHGLPVGFVIGMAAGVVFFAR